MDFSAPSLYPDSTIGTAPVSQQELKTFHSIDRRIYSRLVFDLDRDPEQSMRVMAIWLFLERSKFVRSMMETLLPFSDSLINALAEETMHCLKCLDNEQYNPFVVHSIRDTPLLYNLSKNQISLAYFRENRAAVHRGVVHLIADVCIRAFDDQLARAAESRAYAFAMHQQQQLLRQMQPAGRYYYGPEMGVPPIWTPSGNYRPQVADNNILEELKGEPSGGYLALLLSPYNDDAASSSSSSSYQQVTDINAGMAKLAIGRGGNEGEGGSGGVPADERTVFLTFSKGYPVSEREVREFFSIRYGDIYEDVQMQEVTTAEEQPLYAKLVLRVQGMVQIVLNGKRKAKFSINGKHVCARKYAKKAGTPQ